jgi:[histone H3]-trimethyl-L-lysine9/36 demethylase
MFCWHKEDLDLYSINFLHFGKPKVWYCLPSSENEKFERLCRFHFPDEANVCKEFLRHKSTQISPTVLKAAGIKFHKAVHNPGEFIVIFSKSYHMGFNSGFNCAEAVNFALAPWLDIAETVKRCQCDPDCVQIDLEEFKAKLAVNRAPEAMPYKRHKKNDEDSDS